jgi:hypothetical protein
VVRAFLTNKWANKYIVPNATHRSFLTIDESTPQRRLIPLSQVNQNLVLAGQIRNGAGFGFFGRS